MSDMNPYQQPQSDVANAAPASANEFTIIAPRKISVGDAMGWIGKGHGMLSGHWGVVLGALVVTVLITSALQIIPLLGAIAQILLTPLLYAGIVKIFHRIDTENRSDFSDLFAGFSDRTSPLIMTAVAQFVVLLVAGVVLGGLFFLLGRDGSTAAIVVLGLLATVAMFVFMFLFYFAVPLIFLGQKGVVDAMKLSLDACLKNIIPFIVYTLVISLILVVAAIPLLLGWLFVMPILAGAYYVSFKQLFVE
ncbi:BPSS1780 family membrane protein [Alcanivorax sp.]|uniref:BPSS1780 family membrane protein n=1 Tax=Alcanivorax sp. TaxID=1872427 RepID=UPI000C0DA4A7|nr:BPSS1780 family membrane protein [Alcanivorax sp.]PHR68662.1 MAG: chromosome partitioning protein ParB [Alcanivorax sp.]